MMTIEQIKQRLEDIQIEIDELEEVKERLTEEAIDLTAQLDQEEQEWLEDEYRRML